MMKKWLSVALISSAALLPHTTFASDALLQKAQQENRQQQSHNVARESGFKKTQQELQAMKNQLVAERAALQAEADTLSVTFSENESQLAQLEEKLRLETGSLGELFGVVRQNAKELESELKYSVTGVDANSYQKNIDDIVAAKSLPTLPQLSAMWRSMEEQDLGRVSLVARSLSGEHFWSWSQQQKEWQAVGTEQKAELDKAFAMANKQIAPSMLTLPVSLNVAEGK